MNMQKNQEQYINMEEEGDIIIFDKGGGRNGTIKNCVACVLLNTS